MCEHTIINLTRGKQAIVSVEDLDRINQHSWQYEPPYPIKGTQSLRPEAAKGRVGKKLVKLHRFILNLSDSKVFVDHIDHNRLNNARCNLRLADNSQNQQNKLKGIGSSQFKGVSKRNNGRWRARIKINKKEIPLGHFTNEIDAAKAYDEAAVKFFGEFAVLNFKKT